MFKVIIFVVVVHHLHHYCSSTTLFITIVHRYTSVTLLGLMVLRIFFTIQIFFAIAYVSHNFVSKIFAWDFVCIWIAQWKRNFTSEFAWKICFKICLEDPLFCFIRSVLTIIRFIFREYYSSLLVICPRLNQCIHDKLSLAKSYSSSGQIIFNNSILYPLLWFEIACPVLSRRKAHYDAQKA